MPIIIHNSPELVFELFCALELEVICMQPGFNSSVLAQVSLISMSLRGSFYHLEKSWINKNTSEIAFPKFLNNSKIIFCMRTPISIISDLIVTPIIDQM